MPPVNQTVPPSIPREEIHPPPQPMGQFSRRVVVAVLITLLLLALAALLWSGIRVLLEAFAGALLALLLYTLSDRVSRWTGLRYGWSLALVIALLLVLAGGTSWLLASRLSSQLSSLTQQLPQSFQAIRDYLSQYEWGRHLLENAAPTAASLATEFTRRTGLVSGVEQFIVGVIVILFVGLFGAAEPAVYRNGLLHVIPPRQRRRAGEAIDAVGYNLRWWLVGQVMLMVMMWITTTVGLWLIGIPLAVALGVIAGVLEIVPYAGPWLSAVPALLIALLLSPFHLAAVAALYLALHVVEGYLLAPLVQRGVAEIPPALTLVAQVLMGELLGVLGLLVAAPLTVAAVVLLKMLYVEDTLGDQGVEVPGEPGGDVKPAVRSA